MSAIPKQMEFTVGNINKLAEALNMRVWDVKRKAVSDFWKTVTPLTPVDTGRARSNWLASAGDPRSEEVEPGSGQSSGEVDSMTQNPPGGNTDADLWCVNNVDYAIWLEMGHSDQAPKGMAKIAASQVQAEIDSIWERLN